MQQFSETIQVRWSDVDANLHIRHSVYYDYGASLRIRILNDRGLTMKKLQEFVIGPILFREEAIFKRELTFEDQITVTVELVKTTPDYKRWSLRHNFLKSDGALAAVINLDGAWIDLEKRKLATPNEFIQNIFETFPKSHDFQLIVPEKQTVT